MNKYSKVYNKDFYIISLLFLPLALWYLYYTLQYPFFSFSDEHELINFFLGQPFPFHIIPESGRFYPFSLLEYYPIANSSFTLETKMFLMYLLNALKAACYPIIFFFCIKNFFDTTSSQKNLYLSYIFVAVFLVIAIKYSFINIANSLIFSEFSLTLLFLIYLLLYLSKNRSLFTNISMYLIFFVSLFFKETAFILYVCLSFGTIIKTPRRDVLLHCIILLSSIIYLFLYYFFIHSHTIAAYASPSVLNIDIYLYVAKFNFLLSFGIVYCLYRIYQVVIKKSKMINADIFLSTGIIYSFAFIILGLTNTYLYLPTLVLAVLAIAGYLYPYIQKIKIKISTLRIISILSLLVVLFVNYDYINNRSEVYTLKKTTFDIVKLIDDINKNNSIVYYTDSSAKDEWYAHVIEKFTVFYTGTHLKIERVTQLSSNNNKIIFVQGNRNIEKDLSSKNLVLKLVFCDIIVDKYRDKEIIEKYRKTAIKLLSYKIRPLDANNIQKSLNEIKLESK